MPGGGSRETRVSGSLGLPSSGWEEGSSKRGLRSCLMRYQLISRQEESGTLKWERRN